MLKILFVIPDLACNGAAKQLTLLATHLPRDRFDIRVCVMGNGGPLVDDLESFKIPVDVLNWTRLIDPNPLRKLRKLVKSFKPHVIHAWKISALRSSQLASLGTGTAVVASACFPVEKQSFGSTMVNGRLLKKATRVVASGETESKHYQSQGLKVQSVVAIPPGALVNERTPTNGMGLRAELQVNSDCKLLACVGPLIRTKGHLEAIWALDILHYLYDNLHLVILGTGPDLPRLKDFTRATGAEKRVHFLGDRPDVPQLLAEVDLAWIPSLADVGGNFMLEVMAAGKAFVASRWPRLNELVPKPMLECLVEPGDKAAFARQTRLLLDDQDRRNRLGEIGRQHVRDCFSVTALSNSFTNAYESIAL